MSHIISIPIGDWSGDGHNENEILYFKSNKSIKHVREAYFTAKEKYPELCPESFCCNYQDYKVPKNVVEDAKKLGFNIDPDNFLPETMAEYTSWFCKLGDDSLELTMKNKPPMLQFYGFDKKKRHIGGFGDGLFFC
jgi:hypothetical protein